MEILNTVFTFVSNNILTKAEFFVGLIVLVGYILLGRKWYETLAGFLKAVVGYMILNVGSAGLINTFRPILAGLNQKFHLNAVVIDPYFGLNAVNAALENIGLSAAWTMTSLLLAFIWNIILLIFRKFTKLRTLLLTGHIMVQQATTVTWIVFLFIPGLRNIWGAVAVGILVGTYQAVFSNLTVEPTDRLTDGEGGFAIGHQQMFAIWLADKIAPKIGKKEDSIENIKLPGFLQMFSDNVVSTSVLMFIFFGIIMLVLGEDFMRSLDDTFSQTTAFVRHRGDDALDHLRQDDLEKCLCLGIAEHLRGLILPARDGFKSAAVDLGKIRRIVDDERDDDRREAPVARHRDAKQELRPVEDDHQLQHQRRSAHDGDIRLDEAAQRRQSAAAAKHHRKAQRHRE